MSNLKTVKNVIKATGVAGAVIAGLGLYALTNVYVIKDTEVGVRVRLGEIQSTPVDTGMAFTIPFIEEIRRVETTEQKIELPKLTLTTKADAASPATGNVIITYAIKGSEAPGILKNFGNIERFVDTRISQPMYSQARILASSVLDTRTLMLPATRISLGENLAKFLNKSATGADVRQVMVQSIYPHQTIARRINQAAQRIEDDKIEQHNLTLAETAASTNLARQEGIENVEQSKARAIAFKTKEIADADAHRRRVTAEANAHSIRETADAELYRDQQKAVANAELSNSLTDILLEERRIANENVLFSNSRGNVPHTVIGTDSGLKAYGIPVAAPVTTK